MQWQLKSVSLPRCSLTVVLHWMKTIHGNTWTWRKKERKTPMTRETLWGWFDVDVLRSWFVDLDLPPRYPRRSLYRLVVFALLRQLAFELAWCYNIHTLPHYLVLVFSLANVLRRQAFSCDKAMYVLFVFRMWWKASVISFSSCTYSQSWPLSV